MTSSDTEIRDIAITSTDVVGATRMTPGPGAAGDRRQIRPGV
jgi:hypothetical protein